MCTNRKYIINRYTGKRLLVNCGKCEACLQEKADRRAQKIRFSFPKGYIGLFTTLTYDNAHLPVIPKYTIGSGMSPIYRLCDFNNPIAVVAHQPYDSHLRTPRNYPYKDYAAVPFFKDIQNFYKRLRINLLRDANYSKPFKYFNVCELGPTTQRPHFHTITVIPAEDEELFRHYIVESWPFADSKRTANYIKVAIDAASYVASYVSRSTDLPKIFQDNSFRQKHSHSLGFGLAEPDFQLPALLEKISRGNLTVMRKSASSSSGYVAVPIPVYALNRFFPKFKGFSRLSTSALDDVLFRFAEYADSGNKRLAVQIKQQLKYTRNELRQFGVAAFNRLARFKSCYPDCSAFDYILWWKRCQAARFTTLMRVMHEDIERFPFDNLDAVVLGAVNGYNFTQRELTLYGNPNKIPDVVHSTDEKTIRFNRLKKRAKDTNLIMSSMNMDV